MHPLRRRNATAALILFGAALASACGPTEPPPLQANGRPVILISIDSLRADHCSAYGYQPPATPAEETTPFLAQLAARGVLFENASSTTSWTLPAHMSLLTGMSCREHGVRSRTRKLAEGTEHLAGRFRRAGYGTGAFYSGPFVHPSWGFGYGFDTYQAGSPYLAGIDASAAIGATEQKGSLRGLHHASHEDSRCSERVVDKAIAWLEQENRHAEPFFVFLHLWDPHYDYQPPAEYAERFSPGYAGKIDGSGFMDASKPWQGADLARFLALYDGEIRYTDDQVARLWRKIEEWGLADQVVFAVTSDHGDEFFEHGQKGHQKTLYEEVTHIPLVLAAPGAVPAGQRVAGTASLYDLAPTLLDLAGLPPWEGRTGRSLRTLWEGAETDRGCLLDLEMPAEKWSAWRNGTNKYVWDRRRQQHMLFDLRRDPGEQRALRLKSPDVGPLSREGHAAIQRAASLPGSAAPMEITPEMEDLLAEVGYVDGSAENGTDQGR